ncbi:MAG: hypothetical protein NTW73_00175 [Candidatus Parcubacteria bacterium]|nr:hypothetical protein [Candidatus Parcubacteria bacterium]
MADQPKIQNVKPANVPEQPPEAVQEQNVKPANTPEQPPETVQEQNVKPANVSEQSPEAVQKQILELRNRIGGIEQERNKIRAQIRKIEKENAPDAQARIASLNQEHGNLTKEAKKLKTELFKVRTKNRLPGQANLLPVINAHPPKALQKSWLPELGNKNPKNVDDLVGNVTANTIDFSIYIILFGIAIIKDILDILINLIPYINLFTFVISAPFTIIIFAITLITGKFGGWRIAIAMIAQLLDWVPIVSFIPITTISILLLVLMEKTGVGKIVSQIPIPSKNLAKTTIKK